MLHPDGEPVTVVEVLQIWVPVGALASSKLVVGGKRWELAKWKSLACWADEVGDLGWW